MAERSCTQRRPWKTHTKKILVAASLIVIPMVAFTVAILAIVFSNIVDLYHCPEPELCPYRNVLPTNGSDYYVDFSVGRLAFVSSLSSTISLALVAAVMTTYGYIVADGFLRVSKASDTRDQLPSPFETSTIKRLLNAEVFLLFETLSEGFHWLLQLARIKRRKERARQNDMLCRCRSVFMVGVFISLLVQAADTYLHVVINAVSIHRLEQQEITKSLHPSRKMAPWYFDEGSHDDFYRGSISYSQAVLVTRDGVTIIANRSAYLDATSTIGAHILNYTDSSGISYAVVRPSNIDPDLDWTGSSYAVSTRCSAIPQSSCPTPPAEPWGRNSSQLLNCSVQDPKMNISLIADKYHKTWTMDWHEYMYEDNNFGRYQEVISHDLYDKNGTEALLANMTLQQSNAVFRNPWHWLSTIDIWQEDKDVPKAFSESPLVLREYDKARKMSHFFFLTCNTTVFDTRQTVVNDQITSLDTSASNGSVTGLVSMMSLRSFGNFANGLNNVLLESNRNYTTPEAFIDTYALAMSKHMAVPLVVHTVPAPANVVQRRVPAVITKLPKVALWLLVAANTAFAILGSIIAVLAMRVTSPNVHQIQIRLSTAGIAAQLFNPQHSRRKAKDDKALFEETSKNKLLRVTRRVGVQSTSAGGAEFFVHDGISKPKSLDEEDSLALRHTHTL